MKTLILIITSITIGFGLNGCENDRSIVRTGMVQIENFIITDTIFTNEFASISVKASASDGCWSDLYVDIEKEDLYEYSIKAYGTFSCFDGGCVCPAVMVYHDTIINFQPTQTGTYLFRIQKNRNITIIDTLIVK
jgi:hypothetical protein